MEEIWRPVNGYEGYYEVSNLGRVRSLPRVIECYNHRAKAIIPVRIPGKVLKANRCADGHETVSLSKNNEHTIFGVHRLVAVMFIDNPENKPFVDHINTIPFDNRVDNIRWVDAIENSHNLLTVQRSYKKGYLSQFRSGKNPSQKARANKKRGIGVYSYSADIHLTNMTKHGAFVSLSILNGEKICDFGVSYDSLIKLKDEIEEYIKSTKMSSK